MRLFDTNILIYYLQGIKEVVAFVESGLPSAISIISQIELLGRKNLKKPEITQLQGFLDTFFIINLEEEIAEQAAILRRKGLKMGDAIVGATALFLNAPLITNDSDFEVIPEIKMVNPFSKKFPDAP